VPFGTIGSTSMGRSSRKLARSPELTNDHLSTTGKIVEIVRPLLHHAPALGEVLRVVVGGTDLVAFVMGKLAFARKPWTVARP
jgi:hypothetical protein